MNKFKKLLLLCAAFMATISIAACGGMDNTASSSPDSSEPAGENSSPDESSPDESSPDESSPDEENPDGPTEE